jgi:RND family efflux transporter MFP subunit
MDVRPGTQVEIKVENCPDTDCVESISFVGDTVDPDSRTFGIEVLLDNPDRRMKPGMIATMQIILDQIDDALVIPQESVLRTENGYQVFVVEEEEGRDVARARAVELGPNREDRIVVDAGLAPGERVVTLGQLKLGDGDLVNIVNGSDGSAAGDLR